MKNKKKIGKRKNKRKTYSHITRTERHLIAEMVERGCKKRKIARALKRSVSSIADEINGRSICGVYDPKKAHLKAYVKRKYSKYEGMKIIEEPLLRVYVEEKLEEGWAPEAISGRIKHMDTHYPYVSAKGIYKFVGSVYGRKLEKFLRYRGNKKKGGSRTKVTKLEGRVFIDKRPKIVEKRRRFGDWEGDFIVSGKNGSGALLVLYERKSRYVIIRKLFSRDIATVNLALQQALGGMICVNTLTLDNDISFRKHKELSLLVGAPVFFCHPYHSWEKGGVENMNKWIREYVPKGSDISKLTNEFVKMVENKLNGRPRKCLQYKMPREVMEENKQFKKEVCDMMEKSDKSIPSPFISLHKKTPVFGFGG